MRFSLDAGTFTLKNNIKNPKNSILDRSVNYEIPIYQRPYSWKKDQIQKLISDIFISFSNSDTTSGPEPMFIGTMQLSSIENNTQQIIDGQQRITTLLILLKVLSLKFDNFTTLNNLTFDWLKTKVNNGKQQDYLTDLINLTSLEQPKVGLNKYLQNAVLINELISKNIEHYNEKNKTFKPIAFVEYLYSNIYFVVIETNAGLSKTLKIFDAINTTGLDLNTGDLFKIRMFEYLEKDGNEKTSFNEISKLYEKIEEKNKAFEYQVTDIRSILNIYRLYLIAKYKLPKALYKLPMDTFYDQLFETLFNINKWPYFKNNVEDNKVKLSLEEISDIIDLRYEWEKKWITNAYGNAINKSLEHLWGWSRYGNVKIFKFVFLFIYKDDEKRYEKLFKFLEKLIKVYLLYSVAYKKTVGRIKGQFNNQLLDFIVNGSYENLINHVEQKLTTENESEINRFKKIIAGNILYSNKVKNILCRLSGLLEEDYTTEKPKEILEITKKLFKAKIDIEHIQSKNDENLDKRVLIKDKWGENLDSLGNLVILEQNINRSINNRELDKLKGYKDSNFEIVKTKLVSEYEGWELKKCEIRKDYEVEKICNYLFNS